MATNKRKYWGELSLKERAQFYPYYIAQGITSPKEIGEAYDNDLETEENNIYSGTDEDTQKIEISEKEKLDEIFNSAQKTAAGGKQNNPINRLVASLLNNKVAKKLAYNLSTQPAIASRGSASIKDIVKGVISPKKSRKEWGYPEDGYIDDNKLQYLFPGFSGDDGSPRYKEIEEPVYGFDYSKYNDRNGFKNVKEYYGTINDENKYIISDKNRGLAEELAKNKAHIYIQTPDNTGDYFDDVNNYIASFDVENGHPVIHASDEWDINTSDYNSKYARSLVNRASAYLMQQVGQPYILRQEHIPVYYSPSEDYMNTHGFMLDWGLNDLSDKDIANKINSGLISPSIIIGNKKSLGGNLYDGETENSQKMNIPRKISRFMLGPLGSTIDVLKDAVSRIHQKKHTENTDLSREQIEALKRNVENIASDKDTRIRNIAAINGRARQMNIDFDDVASYYDEGRMNPYLGIYGTLDSGRARENTSKTSDVSTQIEDTINYDIYSGEQQSLPNMKYAVPYIPEKEIYIDGFGEVSTNALDSLAKYGKAAGIPLVDALGLAGQETLFGKLPKYNFGERIEGVNYGNTGVSNAFANSSYFKNYGWIPAEYLVRDFRYNRDGAEADRSIPPLLHAMNYYKIGKYNRGDTSHNSDVRAAGNKALRDSDVQEWLKTSPYAY